MVIDKLIELYKRRTNQTDKLDGPLCSDNRDTDRDNIRGMMLQSGARRQLCVGVCPTCGHDASGQKPRASFKHDASDWPRSGAQEIAVQVV